MVSTFSSRRFSHVKFLLLILYVLKYDLPEGSSYYQQLFAEDSAICGGCFHHQAGQCSQLFQHFSYDDDFPVRNFINFLLPASVTRREIGFLHHSTNGSKIVAKHFAREDKLQQWRHSMTVEALRGALVDPERLDGFQYCPAGSLQRFVDVFPKPHDLSFWLYMVLNVQSILLPLLHLHGFPVPVLYASCGFSQFQEYSGKTLKHYYGADFGVKLNIAKSLLEAVVQFSHGLKGYRIYIADLTADNIAYNEETEKISLIDLDTVLIVGSAATKLQKTHKHVYIECDDCFAYSQEDICEHSLSDINLFAACQLLREDLRRDRSQGFLSPIPDEFAHLRQLLDECVDCAGTQCKCRFDVVDKLIKELSSPGQDISFN